MNIEDLTRKIRAARSRKGSRRPSMAGREAELEDALSELQTAWEELNTAEEELLEQNQELAQARYAVEAEQRRYAELFEMAPDGYLVTDPHGNIREANRAALGLLGLAGMADPHKPLPAFIDPASRRGFRLDLSRLPRVGKKADWEVRIHPHRGEPFYGSFTAAVVTSEDGKPTAIRWLLRDVTARKTAEKTLRAHTDELERRVAERTAELVAANREKEALLVSERQARMAAEEANRSKDTFLANLSHELRTPLTALVGWVHILRRGEVDADTERRALEVIDRSARSQVRLIEEILDVSRIVAGKLTLEMCPVDLVVVVDSAASALRPSAEGKQLTLDVRLPAHSLPVLGDADRLQQVLWNVLSNAIKFTPAGGRIGVTVAALDGSAEIRVSDTGRGITPEFLSHVFDRFRQAETSAARVHGGLGLGLAIARHLVERHGGTIRAESSGPGQGSSFIMRFPLREDEGLSARVFDARRRLPERTLPEVVRVLLVDDDAETIEVMAAALRQAGMQVSTACSSAEAVERVRRQRPDVIVSDIAMPEEDGFALIKRIREEAPGWTTPSTIALTGYIGLETAQKARAAGFDQCLAKPVLVDDLVAKVAAAALRAPKGGQD